MSNGHTGSAPYLNRELSWLAFNGTRGSSASWNTRPLNASQLSSRLRYGDEPGVTVGHEFGLGPREREGR